MNIPSHNPKTLGLQLKKILSGIEKNSQDWQSSKQVNNEIIKCAAESIEDKLKEIHKCEKLLSNERAELTQYLNDVAKPLYKKARDQAYSIYGKKSEKLKEYNFKNFL
ncbi:MAG: hypothetical protein K1X86_14380 [Ignavibacteria bacterium]|nr:hypothetical protein [Ignavibacteria bacterium]